MFRRWLGLVPLLGGAFASGCAEAEAARLPESWSETVQLAGHEPLENCLALERVEVRARRGDGPFAEALRLYAYRRDANYIALDTFTILDESDEDQVLVRARLFRCPPLLRVQ